MTAMGRATAIAVAAVFTRVATAGAQAPAPETPSATTLQSPPPAAAPQAPEGPNPDAHYVIGPDSLPQDGVPKGEVRGPFVIPSQAYPGTQHTYWIYVPAQYDAKTPTSLMVFNDGQAFKD